MNRKGQSAMEYVTTYGWAILVVIIVGVVIWQLGLLDFNSRFAPGMSGFSILVPREWKVSAVGQQCTLSLQLLNGGGEEITGVATVGGSDCVNSTVPAGGMTTCGKDLGSCGSAGSSYNVMVIVTYNRSSDNQQFQTAGNIWGNVEKG